LRLPQNQKVIADPRPWCNLALAAMTRTLKAAATARGKNCLDLQHSLLSKKEKHRFADIGGAPGTSTETISINLKSTERKRKLTT